MPSVPHVRQFRPHVSAGPTPTDPLTEAFAAERLARLHGEDVRFDHRRGRWLLWQGHRWAPDADAAITRLALDFARTWQRESVEIVDLARRQATFNFAVRLEKRDALRSMLALAADLRPIAEAGDGWDTDPSLLCTPNGVVDLRTGALRHGRRADRITMATGTPYDPTAQSDRWANALRSILVTDETISFFQTAIGYSATGDMRRDCWFLAQGAGRNGKGTVTHPIRRALGDYAGELPAAVFDARRDGAPYDLAVLPGKRFVVSSESGDTIKIHHDRIKQISGGDPIRAANKYEKSFEFQPVCKLWLSANRKPRVTDDSPAFWARVMLVPFTVSFVGREDRDLRPALEHDPGNQSAILAWIVAGAVRYYQRGLDAPDTVRAATTAYEQECDPLADFLADACELDSHAEIGAADIYRHYQRWAGGQGLAERERLSMTAFGLRMGTRFNREHTRAGKVYLGITGRAL
ncbi:MAG: phage/plasmid primase, P4 family [Vicinamibacterales bacterium]